MNDTQVSVLCLAGKAKHLVEVSVNEKASTAVAIEVTVETMTLLVKGGIKLVTLADPTMTSAEDATRAAMDYVEGLE